MRRTRSERTRGRQNRTLIFSSYHRDVDEVKTLNAIGLSTGRIILTLKARVPNLDRGSQLNFTAVIVMKASYFDQTKGFSITSR